MTPSTPRQQFREVLATLAAKTKTKIPALNGRVEKAVRLALAGDVELHANGAATVCSSSDPTRRYEIIEGTCTCQDWDRAPQHLCQHRLSAGLVRKATELLPQSTPVETEEPVCHSGEPASRTPAPLPEAPASANCHVTIEGRQVQITLRDTDETRLLQRLTAVLQQYPLEAPAPAQGQPSGGTDKGWCATHQVQMKWNEGKEGRKGWFSHRDAEGAWCKGK